MTLIRPQAGETTLAFLQRLNGRFILLNVTVDKVRTSVCVNKRGDGSGAWRRREEDRRIPMRFDSPGFSVIPNTLALTFDDVNVLASNFQSVFEVIPGLALDKQKGVAVGKLPRDSPHMGQLLTKLESLSEHILEIHTTLDLVIDTPSHALYQAVVHHTQLMDGPALSNYANTLLDAFGKSQAIYDQIVPLRGFGSGARILHRPEMRGALLRYYMQHNPTNPLSVTPPLNFVDYELKCLHLSKKLKWNCESDPRTESVDLLLSFDSRPVITEVKMSGDSFVSAAVVQLMYYASIMANERQMTRVRREHNQFTCNDGWLCIIAEDRDESKSNERGFQEDLCSAIAFLQHDETLNVMSQFFQGVIVVRIEEQTKKFCSEKNIPAFQVAKDGEAFISWR